MGRVSAPGMDRGVGGSGAPPKPSVNTIIRVVADDFGMRWLEMISGRRNTRLVRARQVAMWLARRLTRLSYSAIGREFGRRDHTTIIYGCSRIDALMMTDADLAERVIRLMSALAEGMAVQTSPLSVAA